MNFLEIMLGEKLKDADSALDVTGSDRKVLQVACQDFTNFLKFHWELIGKEASQCELVEKLEKLFKENPAELEEFLGVWTGIWLKKWKQRVKLLIGQQNASKWQKASKNIRNAEPLWKKVERKQEIQEVVVATLIKNGDKKRRNLRHRNPLREPSENGAWRKTRQTSQRQRKTLHCRKQRFEKSTGNGSKSRSVDLRQNRQRLLRRDKLVSKQNSTFLFFYAYSFYCKECCTLQKHVLILNRKRFRRLFASEAFSSATHSSLGW